MRFHNRKRILAQHAAIFMVFLVLTIPFFSASAYALSITKVTIAGGAGVEEVMSADNDYFTATVKTSEEVDADQLYISYTKEEAFDECTGTTCTYTSSQTDRAGQEMEYTIQLLNASVVVDKVTGTVLIDEEEPDIEDYELEREGEDIALTYEVTDTACSTCEGCSGIDYLLLFQDDEEIEKINIASQCSVEDTLETTISELNLEDGTHELCLQAVDNVGYESDLECEAITVDVTGPHFETGSLLLLDAGSGQDVSYIGVGPILVDVFVNVSDGSLNENTVRADLSPLNSFIGSSYENVTANTCEQSADDETLYTCVWESYYVEEVSGALSLKFSASDNEGNEGKYSATYTLTQDTEAPSVLSLYTETGLETGVEDIALSAGKNSLYADLDPTGSAFAQEDVALTVSAANLDEEDPTDCFEAEGYWTCVWNFTVSSSISGRETTATIDATDDAGNDMEQYEFDVTIDTDEPEITSITTSLPCPTASNTLEVVVNATDTTSEDLFVYFYGEDIRTDDDPIIEECEKYEAESFTCLVSVDDLVSYPTDEDVSVEVRDLAGNVADDEVDIDVCELEEAGTPDFVTLSVEDPSPIDAFTLSYIDLPVYVSVGFSMPFSAAIVGKSADCDGAENVYFLDESSTSSLMVVTLSQQELSNTTTELSLDCTLSMTMQYGDKVYANPEVEEFDLDIPVYETPLDEYGLSLQQKIETQKQLIAEKQGRIDRLVTLNKLLGVLCKIAISIAKLNGIMAGVRLVVLGIYEGLLLIPGIGPALHEGFQPVAITTNVVGDTIYSIVVRFFWPIGSGGGIVGIAGAATGKAAAEVIKAASVTAPTKPGLGAIGVVVKTGCIMYSGRYCEGFGGLENIIDIDSGEAGTQSYYLLNNETTLPKAKFTIQYDWDPYRSIHTARSCLYLDAFIYNLRKERQINCMYTTCLEQNAKSGLSAEVCEAQYKERECLYVDSAAWTAKGGDTWFWHTMQLTFDTIFAEWDIWAATVGYYLSPCGVYDFTMRNFEFATTEYVEPKLDADLVKNTFCHVGAGALTLSETNWLGQFIDWDFQANLEGTDYCAGY